MSKETLKETGMSLVESFVNTKLVEKSKDFYATMSRNKVVAINSMYKTPMPKPSAKQKEVKADRDLLQKLFVASQSGREVNLSGILQHELFIVPCALAGTSQKLHPTNKSQLFRFNQSYQTVKPKHACLLMAQHSYRQLENQIELKHLVI